jgi:hypothetical protein
MTVDLYSVYTCRVGKPWFKLGEFATFEQSLAYLQWITSDGPKPQGYQYISNKIAVACVPGSMVICGCDMTLAQHFNLPA